MNSRPRRHQRAFQARLALHGFQHGFTLVELLIGGIISALVLGAVGVLAVHQIRIADRVYSTATVNRSFKRLSDLLKIELGEACLLRRGENPRTTATLPDTPCNPETTSACATPSATADLRLLVPIVATDNTISYSVVRYYLVGTELRRDGPQINTTGQLIAPTLANPVVTGSRVLTNVAAFVPTVSADCTWVSLNVSLTTPGSITTTVTRTLTINSGAAASIY
jgi:type II secretory pathway pseudopilin PulG